MLGVLALGAALCVLEMRTAAKRAPFLQSRASKCVLASFLCLASFRIWRGARCRALQRRQATAKTITLQDDCMQCSAGEISLITWNVLAPCFASRKRYSYVPTRILSWDEYRRQRLCDILRSINADVVCLQEVEVARCATCLALSCAALPANASRCADELSCLLDRMHGSMRQVGVLVCVHALGPPAANGCVSTADSRRSNACRQDDIVSFMAELGYDHAAQDRSDGRFSIANITFFRRSKLRLVWSETRSRALLAQLRLLPAAPSAAQEPSTRPSSAHASGVNASTDGTEGGSGATAEHAQHGNGCRDGAEGVEAPAADVYIANVHLEGHPYKSQERVAQLRSALGRLQLQVEKQGGRCEGASALIVGVPSASCMLHAACACTCDAAPHCRALWRNAAAARKELLKETACPNRVVMT